MKNLLTFVAALVLFTVAAQAQSGSMSVLPGDPGATLVSRIPTSTNVRIMVLGKEKSETIQAEIMIWRTSAAETALTFSALSVKPTNGAEVDFLPTQEIFRQVSANAVRTASMLGHFGPTTQSTKVWHESKVERLGTGYETIFTDCGTYAPVARDYTVSFNNGNPIVVETTTVSAPAACGGSNGAIQ